MKSLLVRTLSAACLTAALAVTPALAQPPGQDNGVRDAVTAPLRDLGVTRREAPDTLQAAAKGPYDGIDTNDCPAMFAEIKQLDELLGPDVTDPAFGADNGSLAAEAVKSVIRLPFGGVVRRLSGAQKREVDRQRAISAGMARRAYLKGAITQCDKHAAPAPAPVEAVNSTDDTRSSGL